MPVFCKCYVLPDRVLCVRLITRPEESYPVSCVRVWSWSHFNEDALTHLGLLCHGGKKSSNKMQWSCIKVTVQWSYNRIPAESEFIHHKQVSVILKQIYWFICLQLYIISKFPWIDSTPFQNAKLRTIRKHWHIPNSNKHILCIMRANTYKPSGNDKSMHTDKGESDMDQFHID
jgi:hypothetical protein